MTERTLRPSTEKQCASTPDLRVITPQTSERLAAAVLIFALAAPAAHAADPALDQAPPAAASGVMDSMHASISRGFQAPAIWFDSFFGDERSEEEDPATTLVRWSNSIRLHREDSAEFSSRIYASVRLPRATRKLRLLVTGSADDGDFFLFSDESDAVGERREREPGSVAVRYTPIDQPRANFSLTGGVRDIPVEVFTRARYRYAHPIGERSLGRLTQNVGWDSDEGWSETTRLDYERQPAAGSLLRLSLSGTYGEESDGLEWGAAVTGFRELSAKSALRADLSVRGVTEPEAETTGYRVGVRYRRSFLRRWLFYEIEPEVLWERENDFDTDPGLILRLEIQFMPE